MSESKAVAQAEIKQNLGQLVPVPADVDIDSAETQEWLASLDYVLKSKGPDRVRFLIEKLRDRARGRRHSISRGREHTVREHDSSRRPAGIPRQSRT